MITLEKHFQSEITKWFGEKKNKFNCVYELKISHGNTIPFSRFEEQQLPSLYQARYTGKNIKLSDALRNLKPFDGMHLMGVPAYVGIMFNIPKNQKEFYFIGIDEVLKIKNSGAKSISKKDCQNLGVKFNLK